MAKCPKELRPPPTPKAKQPWDVPASPNNGNLKPDMTYAAVGRALSQWEKFEGDLAELFAVFAGGVPTSRTAIRAYRSIQTFIQRLTYVYSSVETDAFAQRALWS